MGDVHDPTDVLLLLAVCSRHEAALAWAARRAAEELGSVGLKSDAFAFTETDYYQSTMGTGLTKQFLAIEPLIDPSALPAIKLVTNQWERDYADRSEHSEPRPLNLDPGYLTLAKLVLATTKDHAHRLYLGQGIYGEVTLNYRERGWQACDWTYPDYRREDYQEFFSRSRRLLRTTAN